ncbi:hypothetical protein BC826DRAFT_602373 [Russula brevipes]|nr:hypothetical protein BC826DRAFT_602373 [Russula brevipes]
MYQHRCNQGSWSGYKTTCGEPSVSLSERNILPLLLPSSSPLSHILFPKNPHMAYMRFGPIMPITFLLLIVALLASVRATPSGRQSGVVPITVSNPQKGDVFWVGTPFVCVVRLTSLDVGDLSIEFLLKDANNELVARPSPPVRLSRDVPEVAFPLYIPSNAAAGHNFTVQYVILEGNSKFSGQTGRTGGFSFVIPARE